MINARVNMPKPSNEPIFSYAPGSQEKKILKEQLSKFSSERIEIPIIIGGKEIRTGDMGECVMPHNHRHVLATYHKGNAEIIAQAAKAAAEAKAEWESMPWEARASIFLRAAELLSTKYRPILNAATMLNQSKTVFQAEIDSACELIDFYRFNPYYMSKIYEEQPYSPRGMWNYVEYRPLEGFVFAVTPFNFTSIAGNLPTSPAMMGNTVIWKPASAAVFSAYWLMKLWQEAGLPDGVINMVPGTGAEVGTPAFKHPDFVGVHFTGSTEVFQRMWKLVGENISNYKSYPRIVGETGGKDFVFVHDSADEDEVITALLRGAFEYQGQKCSAASRAYISKSFWKKIKDRLISMTAEIPYGDITDFTQFMGAVIDNRSYAIIKGFIDRAKESPDAEILVGGKCDDSTGYFISPTIIEAKDPHYESMEIEIFGPVLTVYIYDDGKYSETLDLCNNTSPYALTGSIFARDRKAVIEAQNKLRHAAGNFYINDKPTGAVVGQQPFGGSRASGTNDKAGSYLNLIRWVSARTTKETFCPPRNYRYPHMDEV